MSQAGQMQYFARSARHGEEKNKAPVHSPLFLLFRQCSTVHHVMLIGQLVPRDDDEALSR